MPQTSLPAPTPAPALPAGNALVLPGNIPTPTRPDAQRLIPGDVTVRQDNVRAAAPDMLVALHRAREFCDQCDTRPLTTLRIIDAAIGKAEGRG